MGGEWQTKFSVSPGPGFWSLVLGPFGPDLGPDLGPGPELDNSQAERGRDGRSHALKRLVYLRLRGMKLTQRKIL